MSLEHIRTPVEHVRRPHNQLVVYGGEYATNYRAKDRMTWSDVSFKNVVNRLYEHGGDTVGLVFYTGVASYESSSDMNFPDPVTMYVALAKSISALPEEVRNRPIVQINTSKLLSNSGISEYVAYREEQGWPIYRRVQEIFMQSKHGLTSRLSQLVDIEKDPRTGHNIILMSNKAIMLAMRDDKPHLLKYFSAGDPLPEGIYRDLGASMLRAHACTTKKPAKNQ